MLRVFFWCFSLVLSIALNAYSSHASIWGNLIVKDEPSPTTPPTFSGTYSTRGTLYIPFAEISEPFYAWVNNKLNKSRIDYYGGMVKTYQLGNVGPYGVSRKIAPMTTETVTNEDTCFEVNGSKEGRIEIQSVVPDLTGFVFIGEEIMNGQDCQKWQLVDTKWLKINKYSMWIQILKSPMYPEVEMAIPVRYEMKGYNSLLGSHYDHYFIDYEWFTIEEPKEDVFRITSNITCHSFPGPGDDHVYTFNPMKEFVQSYDDHVDTAFDHFVRTHRKDYNTSQEHMQRKDNFRQNMRFIHSKNRANLGFQLGVNHLADLNDAELKVLRGRRYSPGHHGGLPFKYNENDVKGLPENFDWRIYGAVTPVKDQSVCGSCWSFGTTGAIEGALFLKTGKLVRLSQQALIDCSWGFGNNGCDGGEDFRSYEWMMKHGGIPSEDSYGPYLGQDGFCHVDNVTLLAAVKSYVNVTSGDANALKVAISKHGPISVAIDASHKTFSFYSNGVYYEPKCGNKPDQLDHAVLTVGYGDINGKDYWLVKNSWSTHWGNDGYVLMSPKENNCGVMTDPTYVNL